MDVMDVDKAPEEGDGAGGLHYNPELEAVFMEESFSELADRVREVEAMRQDDKGGRSGLQRCTPPTRLKPWKRIRWMSALCCG